MTRIAALVVLLLASAGCTFDPAYDVTCTDENAEIDGKICRGGVWVATTRTGPDAGGDTGGETCVPETDIEICARNGANCGVAEFVDNCGAPRGVNCGVCAGGSECGAQTPNVCFCPGGVPQNVCEAQQACGIVEVPDQCGNNVPVDCGGCDGVASCVDNSCTCDVAAACVAVGANCGLVDVTGTCAGTNEIPCGTCGENSACGDDNVCACEDGFSGDGITCEDVDECAIGTHTCDVNADCINEAPGYKCECKNGYEGDGFQCTSNVRVVKAVRNVTINMDGVTETATFMPIEAQNAVPFVTQYFRDTGEEGDRLAVDVSLTANDEVTIERQDNIGAVTAAVSVVEFDPQNVRVQSGTFSFGGETDTVTLGRPVDPDKAFIVFYYQRSNNSSDRRDLFVMAEFDNGGDEITFRRGNNGGTISGHYWVVESRGSAFDVQHGNGDLAGNSTVNIPITAVDPGKSFVAFSSWNNVNNQAGGRSNVRCGLSATNVRCERASSSDDAHVAVQVISFAGELSVQRGEESFASGDGDVTFAITNVDDSATAFGGAIGVAGTQEQSASGESPGGFFAATIENNGTELRLQRGVPRNTDARTWWQVIDW